MENPPEREKWVISGALAEFAADGELDLVRAIIDVFLSDTQEKIESLQEAVRAGDVAGALRTAHSLKGSARQMGLPHLADLAEVLERSSDEMDSATFSAVVAAMADRWREAKQSVIDTRDGISVSIR